MRLLAVSVDALMEERDALVLNLDAFAEADQWAGGILLDDGRAALVVQPRTIVEGTPLHPANFAAVPPMPPSGPVADRVLIVDDSFTTRTLEKSILEAQGYEVSVAVDGMRGANADAPAQVCSRHFGYRDATDGRFCLIGTDEGGTIARRDSRHSGYVARPSRRPTARSRPGATAYIVKRKFDHQELLNTVRQLL